jgi:hypothetical protein
MSYDISLNDPVTGETIELDDSHQMKGGTYAIGGTPEASLNVTYNYSKYYYKTYQENGIRTIYRMSGAESIPILQKMADNLGDDVSDNYWEPTEGNAKRPLMQLLAFAKMRPDGVWSGD